MLSLGVSALTIFVLFCMLVTANVCFCGLGRQSLGFLGVILIYVKMNIVRISVFSFEARSKRTVGIVV